MARFIRALTACVGATLVLSANAVADVKVSDQAFVRHDGGTDITIAACSSDFSDPTPDAPTPTPAADEGSGERQQNEPTAAVSPANPLHMTSGANEYCPVATTTDAWAGFYYSSDGGSTWTNSLLPGYATDTSVEGRASPLFGLVLAAGDPVQAWDNAAHLYYAGIAFNRDRPSNGSIWLARYNWPMVATAPDYEFTTLVERGTPTPFFAGQFEDKVQLEVDRGAASPFSGNVYLCWTRFVGQGPNNFVEFAWSTDGGRTFRKQKLSAGVHGSQFCDIAVSRTGTVFVAWRQFSFKPDIGQRQGDAVAWVKSTDGGKSFTRPAIAAEMIGWDLTDRTASPAEFGQAVYQYCLGADYNLSGCAGPEPREAARSCGDGPLRCQSGYVFFRANTQVRITADPSAGEGDEAYVVYDASVPTSLTPTGTTFGTVVSGTGSQASVYFIKTTNGGSDWSAPARIDAVPLGHQFFPDIDADSGTLHAVWQDSRSDCAAGPPGTAADFRTVPISNRWVGGAVGSVACGPGLETRYAVSTNGGASWASQVVSAVTTMPQHEQFGNRDTPFFGDYNYIDALGSTALMTWTDHREVVGGTDPRYDLPGVSPDDGTDGFDVHQCRVFAGGAWSADFCPNAGGLDQNIFGLVLGAPAPATTVAAPATTQPGADDKSKGNGKGKKR